MRDELHRTWLLIKATENLEDGLDEPDKLPIQVGQTTAPALMGCEVPEAVDEIKQWQLRNRPQKRI